MTDLKADMERIRADVIADIEYAKNSFMVPPDGMEYTRQNVAVANVFPMDHFGYAEGYKNAAKSLVEVVQTDSSALSDLYVYPVMFLFRHYLELRLKELISRAGVFFSTSADAPNTHDLRELWELCEPLLERLWGAPERDALPIVKDRIYELAEIDPGGEAFRYAWKIDFSSTLPQHTVFYLPHVSRVMSGISYVLDGSLAEVEHRIDSLADSSLYQ